MSDNKLVGKWKLSSTDDNWEKYLCALGVNFALRKIGNLTKPQEEIKFDGEYWYLNIYNTFKDIKLKFKLGEAFEENTVDGRVVQSTFHLEEDGSLVHEQTGKPADCVIIRQADDTTLSVKFTITGNDNVTTVRKFTRIE